MRNQLSTAGESNLADINVDVPERAKDSLIPRSFSRPTIGAPPVDLSALPDNGTQKSRFGAVSLAGDTGQPCVFSIMNPGNLEV